MNIAAKLLSVIIIALLVFGTIVFVITNHALTGLATIRLLTTAETVHSRISGLVAAGVPLQQFSGFQNVTGPLFLADTSLLRITILNNARDILFDSTSPLPAQTANTTPVSLPATFSQASDSWQTVAGSAQSVSIGSDSMAVAVKIRSRRGDVGDIIVIAKPAALSDYASEEVILLGIALGLIVLFAAAYWSWITDFRQGQRRAMQQSVATVYASGGLVIILIAGTITFAALEDRVSSYVNRLAARFEAAVSLGIAPETLGGLDQTLEAARQDEADHAYTAFVIGARIAHHTQPQLVGQRWQQPYWGVSAERQVRARSIMLPELRIAAGLSLPDIVRLFWHYLVLITGLAVLIGALSAWLTGRWVRDPQQGSSDGG